jgi:hypothetical protein
MSAFGERLYRWRHSDLARAAQQVSRALAIDLELRFSTFRGGEYFTWTGDHGAEIVVRHSSLDEDGGREIPRSPSHLVLLCASGLSEHAYEVLGQLDGVELLECRGLPDEPR